MSSSSDARSPLTLAAISVGFGTTVAMWAVGYICRLPLVNAPAPLLLALMLVCLLGGGVMIGRDTRSGWRGGAVVGLIVALLNMLILGSMLMDPETGRIARAAWLWGPGNLIASAALGAFGGVIGSTRPGPVIEREDWRTVFAFIACAATLLVVIAGGLVTSGEAGLAVPDWPNSFGWNMFLYPLSRMTGGIYYEHAHRLYGALVGLTTLILAIVIWRTDRRAWMRTLVAIAFAMVVAQGVMGGLRVDSSLSGSVDFDETAPNLALAIVHGVFAQIFFVTMTMIAAFTARSWRRSQEAVEHPSARRDYSFTIIVSGALLVQLVLGALYRHLHTVDDPIPTVGILHLGFAAVVLTLAFVGGLRAWALYRGQRIITRLGGVMLILLGLQALLGLAALIAVLLRTDEPYPAEIILATAHQANGALLFATSGQLVIWVRRLTKPIAVEAEATESARAAAKPSTT
jgi:cytochrome c oxidase assembly protein subunit 15